MVAVICLPPEILKKDNSKDQQWRVNLLMKLLGQIDDVMKARATKLHEMKDDAMRAYATKLHEMKDDVMKARAMKLLEMKA
jgi:hypothetical protein